MSCTSDPFTSTLFYIDVPRFYTWNNKSWKRRKRGTRQEEDEMFGAAVIGRMYISLSRKRDFVTEMGENQLVQYVIAFLSQSDMQQKEPEWTTEGKLLIMLTKRGRWWFRAQRETSYNVDEEREVVVQSTDRLNEEQRAVHDEFVAAAFNTSGALYF
ncbi:hypothetical protein RRG08_016554 [Elysia crispata]|uniref:Uncharacterized protein n=1 Tax=Elysia crispata TaxID=231223 RepID=A0AAE1CZK1_9GAST|nr:hypothetical protein RRG08_016554 [Elysia crispata]